MSGAVLTSKDKDYQILVLTILDIMLKPRPVPFIQNPA